MISKGLIMVIIGIVGMVASLFFFLFTLFRKKPNMGNENVEEGATTASLTNAETKGIPTETMYVQTSEEKPHNEETNEIQLQPLPSLKLDKEDVKPSSAETMVLSKETSGDNETMILSKDSHHETETFVLHENTNDSNTDETEILK